MLKSSSSIRLFVVPLVLTLGVMLSWLQAAAAQRAIPESAPLSNFNPLCDSTLVHCLEIDDFAGHAYGHLQVLPRTDRRDTAAVFPMGVTLGLFRRVVGGVSTYYSFWREGDALYQQLGPLRLSLVGRLLPLFSSAGDSRDSPTRRFQLGLAYEHEVRIGPFSGANSLGILTNLASFHLVGSKWLGPFYLSASAGALFDWRGTYATGSLSGQFGWLIPGFKQLKVFVGAMVRGIPSYTKKDALPLISDGQDPLQRQGIVSGGLAFRTARRVDLGVEVMRGFGNGIAPWAVAVNFLVVSAGKEHEGRAVTPVAQLAADVAVEAARAVKEFIANLPIDPKLDENCIILDDDLSVMGRFGKRTQDGYYCEENGFKVPIGHELLRDKKKDRLCRDSRKNPATGKRELTDCLLALHGKEWVPVHRPHLDGTCRMIDSDGTVLGYLGKPTEDGKRCRYLGEKDNGPYGKYTAYEEKPIGEQFHTDTDRTAVCVDAAMRQCFMRPPKGQHSLAWNNGNRASTALVGGFEGGLKQQAEEVKGTAEVVKDVATGKVKITTIYQEGKQKAEQALDGATDLLKDPAKRQQVINAAKGWVDRLEDAVTDWSKEPPEKQMEDVLSATGKGGSYLAAGAVTGGLGKAAGKGLGAVATVGNGAAKVEHQAAQVAHAAKVAKTANQVEHASDAVKAEQKAAQAAHAAEQGTGQSKSAKSLLKQHEADGGHTLRKHTNKTNEELKERIKTEPEISAASSFADEATAERVVSKTLHDKQQQIEQWLKSGSSQKLKLKHNGNDVIGRGIDQGKDIVTDRKKAVIILKKKKDGGYYVLTAYAE